MEKAVPHMFVWMDFMSVPQVFGGAMPWMRAPEGKVGCTARSASGNGGTTDGGSGDGHNGITNSSNPWNVAMQKMKSRNMIGCQTPAATAASTGDDEVVVAEDVDSSHGWEALPASSKRTKAQVYVQN